MTTHPTTTAGPTAEALAAESPAARSLLERRLSWLPAVFTVGFLAIALLPPARGNTRLEWSIGAAGLALVLWQAIIRLVAARRGQQLRVDVRIMKPHWVQGIVQASILFYWGWFWAPVYAELPLILSQLLFFYVLDALFAWSRGRTWRLGFGPMPIVVSTNLLLWFVHDWYFLQYAMLAIGALTKQFVTWERDGRRTHIFNPSAAAQSILAIFLIATATTNELTRGTEIAASFETPYMLLLIFLGGLVVQYLFHVTLMTVAAVATLVLINLIYTQVTGVYFFVSINVAAPIFLGVHLLVTDPATSPRTNLGRVIFGVLYGIGYVVLFRIFDLAEVPTFWDKLLPVPILNLCVPLLDRLMRAGPIGRLNGGWEGLLPRRRMNLVHMGLWCGLFAALWFSGYVHGPHPGNSITFWKQAVAEGKPHAGHSLVLVAGAQAEGDQSGAAFNELGLICLEGEIVNENRALAAHYFGRAAALGDLNGAANLAIQFLFLREYQNLEDVRVAFDVLEAKADSDPDPLTCYLTATAYETGRGREIDLVRAIELYERCGLQDLFAAKALARIALRTDDVPLDLRPWVPVIAQATDADDAEACWYVAYMYHTGTVLRQDPAKARAFMQKACRLGLAAACDITRQPTLPPYANPPMAVPGWCTAFPTP